MNSPVGKRTHQDDSKTAFRGKGATSQWQNTIGVFYAGMFGTELASIFSHNSLTFGFCTYDDILMMFMFLAQVQKCYSNIYFLPPPAATRTGTSVIQTTHRLDPLMFWTHCRNTNLSSSLKSSSSGCSIKHTQARPHMLHTIFCLKRSREKKEKYRIKQNISMRKEKKPRSYMIWHLF